MLTPIARRDLERETMMAKTKDVKSRWYNMRRYARMLSKQVTRERGGYLPLHWDVVRDRWPGDTVTWKQLQYTLSPYYEPAGIPGKGVVKP